MNFEKLKEILQNHSSFLLTCHVNPDADAIGSEIALYEILKKLHKKVYIINHSPTPYNLKFLDTDNIIEEYQEEKHANVFFETDVLVCLDFNRADRMVRMTPKFLESTKLKIIIDHHLEPEDFVDFQFCDPSYSSTGEVLYDLIKETKIVPLDYNISVPIYAAIMTDTGSFRFERTSPKIHMISAELLEIGVNPGKVFDSIYDQSKFSKTKLLGRALESLSLFGETEEIAYMVLYKNDFNELSAVESDTDGFVNFSLSIENVKIGMMFIELKDGFKVSFRSKGKIPINKLAAEFGGGGHANAAGARIFNSKLSANLNSILIKAEQYLKHKENL